jgi:ATP-dependent RNA helicase HelY
VPKDFNARSPQSRRDLASTLRAAVPHDPPSRKRAGLDAEEDQELARLRRALRAHPCHGCPEREDHARWGERWTRLKAETDGLTRRVEGRTNSVARTFDRVCELLTELGYLEGDRVTAEGQRLRRLYTELDLVAAECLRAGVWDDLDGPGLASVLSALVHESRREEHGVAPRLPGGPVESALGDMIRIWAALEERERDHRLPVSGEPDAGLAWAMHRWARGHSLEAVLRDSDLAAGDFVRRCKQLVDLLGQVADASYGPVQRAAHNAIERVRRGVVAAS